MDAVKDVKIALEKWGNFDFGVVVFIMKSGRNDSGDPDFPIGVVAVKNLMSGEVRFVGGLLFGPKSGLLKTNDVVKVG